MSQPMDIIPILNDIVEDEPDTIAPIDRTTLFLDELESRLTVAIHEHADELVHNALREMEALLLEQVSDRLKAELPRLISGGIAEHFKGPGLTN